MSTIRRITAPVLVAENGLVPWAAQTTQQAHAHTSAAVPTRSSPNCSGAM
ncbi:hypothetical protein ABZY83_22565 [Streptomyces virginiae]|nr:MULTISPECIES: hypothetical protein [unclassified Streptomyces]